MSQFGLRSFLEKHYCSLKKKDNLRSEYGEIVNSFVISNGIDEIYEIWNESDIEIVFEKIVLNISALCL